MALALVRGQVTLEDFNPETLADPDVLALAARVEAREDSDWGRRQAAVGALRLELHDGRVLSDEVHHAMGSPEAPIGTDRLIGKFVDCCAQSVRPLAKPEAQALAARILDIDAVADCGEIFAV